MVRVTANVSNVVGGIGRMDFYDTGAYAGTANAAPYQRSFIRSSASPFSATVTDVDGNVASAP